MTNLSMPRCDIEELKGQIELLKALNTADDYLIKLLEEQNQQLKELLKQWVYFYPIVLYEYEDTLKTRDIIELYEKTANAIGEKK